MPLRFQQDSKKLCLNTRCEAVLLPFTRKLRLPLQFPSYFVFRLGLIRSAVIESLFLLYAFAIRILSQTRANYVLTSTPTAQLIALACHYLYWACFGAFAALPLAPAAQESLFVALTRCQVGHTD